MRRLGALCLTLLAVAGLAADCDNGVNAFSFNVLGPEAHDNLWQFADVRGWKATASTSYPGGHNHARMVYYVEDNLYAVSDNACQLGLSKNDGATGVCVVEYTAGENTTAQRAFVAAVSWVNTDPITIAQATMRQVPVAAAANNAGTVTVTWTDLPTQAEIIGYRVVRSADGLASWATVADVAVGAQTAPDTPGAGTWYYAVQIRYLGTPTQQVSPHGLAAQVTV